MGKRTDDSARPAAPLSDALTLLPGVPVPTGALPAPVAAPAAAAIPAAAAPVQSPTALPPTLPPPSAAPLVAASPGGAATPVGLPLPPPSVPVVLTAEMLSQEQVPSPAHKAESGSRGRLVGLIIGALVLAAAGAYYVLVLMPSTG